MKGLWYGVYADKSPIFLHFEKVETSLSGYIDTGSKKETFKGTLQGNRAYIKTNSGDILEWEWDNYYRGTLKIWNTYIVMDKLD
jgi:hypothetical protein